MKWAAHYIIALSPEQNAKLGDALEPDTNDTRCEARHARRQGVGLENSSGLGRGDLWVDGLARGVLGVLLD